MQTAGEQSKDRVPLIHIYSSLKVYDTLQESTEDAYEKKALSQQLKDTKLDSRTVIQSVKKLQEFLIWEEH